MTSFWQKIIIAIAAAAVAVFFTWLLSPFRFDSFTGSDGRILKDEMVISSEARLKETEKRIIKKIDENKVDLVKAIDELKKEFKDHKHR